PARRTATTGLFARARGAGTRSCVMSFSLGGGGANMGPRGALQRFGSEDEGRALDWRIVARFLSFLHPYRGRMALAFVLMLISTALTLLTPYLIKVAIDQHIVQGELDGLTNIALLTAG